MYDPLDPYPPQPIDKAKSNAKGIDKPRAYRALLKGFIAYQLKLLDTNSNHKDKHVSSRPDR